MGNQCTIFVSQLMMLPWLSHMLLGNKNNLFNMNGNALLSIYIFWLICCVFPFDSLKTCIQSRGAFTKYSKASVNI